jgi:hypothetical protein
MAAGPSGRAGPRAPGRADLGSPSGAGPVTIRGKALRDPLSDTSPDLAGVSGYHHTSSRIQIIKFKSRSSGL